jgi:transposase InsO family protein
MGGLAFLATVIDCHTKAVIGWAVDDNYRTPLIRQAIELAAAIALSLRVLFPFGPRQQLHVL